MSTAHSHDVHHKPWGHFEVVSRGPGFCVKTLVVHPGSRLSLQRHTHRAEFWVVLQGTAHVQLDDRHEQREAGESIAIGRGQWHRLENRGAQTLVVLEVQSGARCTEDDIERAEDDFGRVP